MLYKFDSVFKGNYKFVVISEFVYEKNSWPNSGLLISSPWTLPLHGKEIRSQMGKYLKG
jgi:hypothetical protein